MKHQPVKQGQTTTPGISSPTLSDKCVGSLTSPANHITLKMEETGPTVYKQLLDEVFAISRDRGYQPQPTASADNPYLG